MASAAECAPPANFIWTVNQASMGDWGVLPLWFVVFFSSRRRHTRFKCDWSSDVCSSDLSRKDLLPRLRERNGKLRCARNCLDGRYENVQVNLKKNSESAVDVVVTSANESSTVRMPLESPYLMSMSWELGQPNRTVLPAAPPLKKYATSNLPCSSPGQKVQVAQSPS